MPDITQLLALLQQKAAQPKRPGFDPEFLADDTQDPSLRADAFSDAMQGELRDRSFQAERTIGMPGGASPNELSALQRLMGSYQAEQAAGPIAQQRTTYDAQNALNLGAQNEGFTGGPGTTPIQQREMERRRQERQKLDQPMDAAHLREAGENARQTERLGANQKMVETQMGPANRSADRADAYQDALLGGQIDPTTVKGFNNYGPQFQTPLRPANTASQDRLLGDARFAAGDAGIEDPLADLDGGSAEQQLYTQRVLDAVSKSGMHPQSQAAFMNLLRTPELRNLPIESLAPDDPNDPDWKIMQQLLIRLRGK